MAYQEYKPIGSHLIKHILFESRSVCYESEVRELESLLQSKEALLDKAVGALEKSLIHVRKSYTIGSGLEMEISKALTEIKEKR